MLTDAAVIQSNVPHSELAGFGGFRVGWWGFFSSALKCDLNNQEKKSYRVK